MTHQTTTILGSEVHYWTYNETASNPIILVHGFRGNHKSLTAIARVLSENRQVILFDLPGHGRSSVMTTSSTVPHFASFLDQFIKYLDLPRFDIWAHSFGGSIALYYASKNPPGLRSLTLVSPAISTVTGTVTQLGKLYYNLGASLPAQLQRTWLASPTVDRMSGALLIRNVSRTRKRALIAAGRRNLQEVIPSVVIESSLSYLKTDFLALARKVQAPTLVIAGKVDPLVPMEQIELLVNNLDYAFLRLLLDHGHLGPLEAPGTVASLTEDFLHKAEQNIRLPLYTTETLSVVSTT